MATNESELDAFGGVSNRLQPRVFEDLRGWIDELRAEGEMQEIDVEVDWDCELGTVARKAFGTGEGPAILFKNISGYNASDSRCSQLFTEYTGVPRALSSLDYTWLEPTREGWESGDRAFTCYIVASQRDDPKLVGSAAGTEE